MKPYYERDGITIYHGDCREIVPTLDKPGLVLADPPYGIAHPCDFKSRNRGNIGRFVVGVGKSDCNDYPDVFSDTEPFDPAWLLALDAPTCLWGANYYSHHLAPTGGWLIWDKERPHELDQATAEMAWTNFVKGVRVFRHLWHGMMRASERGPLSHPTQKPVALMKWILALRWTTREGYVLDPFMGSGPVLVACKDAGRPAIGIEIEEKYCEIAAKRLGQSVIEFGTPGEGRPGAERETLS